MNRSVMVSSVLLSSFFLLSGCNRNQAIPESQTTSGVQPTSQTMTVKGCLKGGLAPNTFVLMTGQRGPDQETATYQLTGRDVDFAKHVGEIVDVFGTVRAEEEIASTAADVVEKPAKGTSGTPTIGTSTELAVKQMTVSSITPSGQRCPE
jgi:hypothetical protein